MGELTRLSRHARRGHLPLIDPARRKVNGAVALGLCLLASTAAPRAEPRPIDLERSTLTVFVYKTGLFSAFADDHVIQAPLSSGSMSIDAPLGVEIGVRAARLKVLDPKLSSSKRAEVQARMLGPEVLDTARYQDITFASTAIESTGPMAWRVTGRLTIHGATRPATFTVTERDGHYRGVVSLKQRDFGIQPISIVGGTVKVKDEIKIEFDVMVTS